MAVMVMATHLRIPTPYGRANEPIPHTNWLPRAIVGTIFGALFSCIGTISEGIMGITKANAVAANKFYNEAIRGERRHRAIPRHAQ